jgi:hypothetical protein
VQGVGMQSPMGEAFQLPALSGDLFMQDAWHQESHLSNSLLPDLAPDAGDQQAESR